MAKKQSDIVDPKYVPIPETSEVEAPAAAPLASNPPPATRSLANRMDGLPTIGTIQKPQVTDLVIPEIILHQGQISAKVYGPGNAGEWVDSITLERMTIDGKKFAPLFAVKTVQVWVKRTVKGIDDRFVIEVEEPADVKPEMMEDADLEIRQHLQYIVMFEDDLLPRMIRFKSPDRRWGRGAYKMGATINTLETVRRVRGKGLGVYTLSSRDITNDKGQWKSKVITPAGDASPELQRLAEEFASAFSQGRVRIHDREREAGESIENEVGAD